MLNPSPQFPGNGTDVNYTEGIDVGYRYYDTHHQNPLFPFGYGLSYTTFTYSGLRLHRPGTAANRHRHHHQHRPHGRRRSSPAVPHRPGIRR